MGCYLPAYSTHPWTRLPAVMSPGPGHLQALGLIGVTNFVSPDPDAYSSAGGACLLHVRAERHSNSCDCVHVCACMRACGAFLAHTGGCQTPSFPLPPRPSALLSHSSPAAVLTMPRRTLCPPPAAP